MAKGQEVRRGRNVSHALPCGYRGLPEGGEGGGGGGCRREEVGLGPPLAVGGP